MRRGGILTDRVRSVAGIMWDPIILKCDIILGPGDLSPFV